jgi:zinc D-Ala-D-Ala carboxypeptidase
MMLSKNLSLAEMIISESAKRKGISNVPTPEHKKNMEVLAEKVFQPIRDHFKTPIYISSGYRSKELNKEIRGSQTSQHSTGEAIDIDMDGSGTVTNKQIFEYIKNNLDFDQLIWEFGSKNNPDWVHVSFKAVGKNRKQVLIARKIDSKTVYLNY